MFHRRRSRSSTVTAVSSRCHQVRFEPAREVDRTMAAAGAADADRELRLAFEAVLRQQRSRPSESKWARKRFGLRQHFEESRHRRIVTGQRLEAGT